LPPPAPKNVQPETTQVLKGFDVAILGDGVMPPIKAGGVRTVVLPPALAFGEAGDGCLYGLEGSCRIPPNSEARGAAGAAGEGRAPHRRAAAGLSVLHRTLHLPHLCAQHPNRHLPAPLPGPLPPTPPRWS
jgi:hypothetical protein